jgi:DNA polymerase V
MSQPTVKNHLENQADSTLTFFRMTDKPRELLSIPFFSASVPAGFPSPGDDFIEKQLDPSQLLVQNPAATFFVRVAGRSMEKGGIFNGDILVVDRSVRATNNKIVIAVLNGELTVKRFMQEEGTITLHPENDEFHALVITEAHDFEVWGVVTSVIRQL